MNDVFHESHTHLHTLFDVAVVHGGGGFAAHSVALLDGYEGVVGFGSDRVLHLLDRSLQESPQTGMSNVWVESRGEERRGEVVPNGVIYRIW